MEFSTDAARRQEPTRHDLKHGTIYEARAEDVYPLLTPGSVSLVHSDGPYAMKIAAWDRMKVSDLAAWYAPHIEAWGRLCAPSASIYHWGTAEGWAAVHPEYLRQGWTFRALITWDKGLGFLAGKCDVEGTRTWPTVTEVCGFYQREGFDISAMARGEVYQDLDQQRCAIEAARFLTAERERCGLTRRELSTHFPSRSGGLTGCVTNWEEGFNFPTWDIWHRLHTALNGYPGAPYLQRDLSRLYDEPSLRAEYESLRAEYESLRAEYESLRSPFTLPPGITNVWTVGQVQGPERMKENAGTLHPCQKPLKFADRIIRASSRPGDLILEPFGGTCRIAVACEQIARYKPADARQYVCVEMNADGVDYIGPVLKQIQDNGKQVTLFEGLGR
jgi:site-specific DNA-methyltransferase (adenine-specific)